MMSWGKGLRMVVLVVAVGCSTPEPETLASPPGQAVKWVGEEGAAAAMDDKAKLPSAQARLLEAYPEQLSGIEGNELVWKDGTRMVWDDGETGKTFEELEAKPDIEDMFTYVYPDSFEWEFVENQDPGRIRNEAFFRKMYGGTAQEVGRNLVNVDWFGHRMQVSKVNGVDAALKRVAKRLEAYPDLVAYLRPPGGGYNWRPIAGTDRLSAHSFGIAVDIHTQFSDYWRWSPEFSNGKALVYKNRIPKAVVEAFEAEGFIWGGKWFHYDTMHFEYRPELM